MLAKPAPQALLDQVEPREILDAQARRVSEPQGPLVPQEPRVRAAPLGVLEPLALGRRGLLDQAAPPEIQERRGKEGKLDLAASLEIQVRRGNKGKLDLAVPPVHQE